ncbi:hypothetical protein N9D31_03635, partial [Oligoflexaceae bacterium]|nr:hypothetical protein [Oligoflexaceae bacterium]
EKCISSKEEISKPSVLALQSSEEVKKDLTYVGDDTLTYVGDDTLSSGKGLAFNRKPNPTDFKNVTQLATGVAYGGAIKARGMSKIKLPYRGSTNHPPMIVLDSCYGDASISKQIFEDGSEQTPVISVINPNPMDLSNINYGALDYFQLLALPAFYAKSLLNQSINEITGKKIATVFDPIRNSIDDYINSNGLEGNDLKSFTLRANDISSKKILIQMYYRGKIYGQ